MEGVVVGYCCHSAWLVKFKSTIITFFSVKTYLFLVCFVVFCVIVSLKVVTTRYESDSGGRRDRA